ncbi:hypothetical protein NQZ68_025474, partial [Dissostichus eleginoides]
TIKGKSVQQDGSGKESVTLKSFLIISVALNVLLPLFVFLFMHRRQKQNQCSETRPASEKNSQLTNRSDPESRLELLPNKNMGNDAVGEETKA